MFKDTKKCFYCGEFPCIKDRGGCFEREKAKKRINWLAVIFWGGYGLLLMWLILKNI